MSACSNVKKELYLLEQESRWSRPILLLNERKENVKRRFWVQKTFKKEKIWEFDTLFQEPKEDREQFF